MSDRWHGFTVDPQNIPLPRAGVYLIRHLPTGKCYVGAAKNVEKRCYSHAKGAGNVPALDEVISEYSGKRSQSRRHVFEVVPLWYAIDPAATKKTAGTHFVEQAMIVAYDSINHGWNQPHPDVGVLCKSPQAIRKRQETEASITTQINRSSGAIERWSTRSIAYTRDGETKSLAEWSRITGIPYETLWWRYQQGYAVLESSGPTRTRRAEWAAKMRAKWPDEIPPE